MAITQTINGKTTKPWRVIFAGLCASLIANGFGRFAYTPLIPAQIAAHWFTPSQTIYFGAANIAGYLLGALTAGPLGRHVPNVPLLRGSMLLATASFFACATPLNPAWFFAWRLIAGVMGGYLMVLAAPMVLPHVPPARRGLAAGAIFLGVGAGILASGTLIPILLRFGVAEAWLGIAVASLILSLVVWSFWPKTHEALHEETGPLIVSSGSRRLLRALYAEYALTAVGQVTHVLFLVDFIARGLGRGVTAGAIYWLIWGIGAVIGPLVAGYVADRLNVRRTLRLSLLLQAVGVLLPVFSTAPLSLALSSLIIGSFISGSVAITLSRARELTSGGSAAQAIAWGRCTASFAIGQAIAAYAYSAMFANFGDLYLTVFTIGGIGFTLALLIDLLAGADARAQDSERMSS
jgi:predicted MFS family arabinose efflux permease